MSRSYNRRKFYEAKQKIKEVLLANPQWATTRVEADIRQLAQLYQSINRILTDEFRIYASFRNDRFIFTMEILYQEKGGKIGRIFVDFDSTYRDFIDEIIMNFMHFVKKEDNVIEIMKVALKPKLYEIRTKSLQALERYKVSIEFRSKLNEVKSQAVSDLRRVMKSLDLLNCTEEDMLNVWREIQVQKVMDT